MIEAFICDAVRTPFGRYGGAFAALRADDLAAAPLRALVDRNRGIDWEAVDDVVYGCANQAGEDNRNIARMALLLAGVPASVPGTTVNRLCGSSMDALAIAARAIKSGEVSLVIVGGVESMSRAPFVMAKSDEPFSRAAKLEDTTLGWRFVNPAMKAKYGVDSMPETAENVAEEFNVSRADQDALAWRSQQRAASAIQSGRLAEEIVPVKVPQKKGDPICVQHDEHPAARDHTRGPRKVEAYRQADRNNHGRQRVRHQRWCMRAHRGLRRGRAQTRTATKGPPRRVRCCRSRPADHGYRSRARHA